MLDRLGKRRRIAINRQNGGIGTGFEVEDEQVGGCHHLQSIGVESAQ
ncbi:MAG: hypothetical protein IPL99_15675 [Candidatus Competibacteraceae bacterium]|nr:hypothetical protein [Candidatus Competibacteraceae bacterium]